MLPVRQKTMPTIPKCRRWQRFATKRQLAARLAEWIVPILKTAGKTVWIVIDGGDTRRPFPQRVLKLSHAVNVGRLRKDAAQRDLPPKRIKGQRRGRDRPRKYGKKQTQPGQARWAEGRLASRRLYGLWRSGDQDVQDFLATDCLVRLRLRDVKDRSRTPLSCSRPLTHPSRNG